MQFITSIWNWISSYGSALVGYIADIWNGILAYVANLVTVVIPNFVWEALPDSLTQSLQDIDFQVLFDLGDAVTWFYPLWGVLTIYFGAYSTAAVIRLVRFIIGWIPTVEG